MSIKLDASDFTMVAHCSSCHWSAMRSTRASAYSAGLEHERAVHPAELRAIKTLDELVRRHAAK